MDALADGAAGALPHIKGNARIVLAGRAVAALPDALEAVSYTHLDVYKRQAFGGMDLLDSTLNTNFGVEIAGHVEVDFGEFQTLIDSTGGIDLELTQDEADYICGRKRDVTYPQPVSYTHLWTPCCA